LKLTQQSPNPLVLHNFFTSSAQLGLIDIIHCLFEGRKELFGGLFIYDRWDWSQKFPVIHLDFLKQKAESSDEVHRPYNTINK
ncbi:MAG: AAA family ATPase, partial [Myxococcota bacterium]